MKGAIPGRLGHEPDQLANAAIDSTEADFEIHVFSIPWIQDRSLLNRHRVKIAEYEHGR